MSQSSSSSTADSSPQVRAPPAAVPPMEPISNNTTSTSARERINNITTEQCNVLMRRYLTRTTNRIGNPLPGGRDIYVIGDTFDRLMNSCRHRIVNTLFMDMLGMKYVASRHGVLGLV
jgi:hypothetical protein